MATASARLSACCLLALLPAAAGCASPPGGGGGGPEFEPVYHAAPDARVRLEVVGRYDGGFFPTSAPNNPPAFDPETGRLFVPSGLRQSVEILDLRDPGDPDKVADIDVLDLARDLDLRDLGPLRSVAFRDGVLAIALSANLPGGRGVVAFYDARGRKLADPVRVGADPNGMAFTPDGGTIVLANTGRSVEDPVEVDAEGSVSLVRLNRGDGGGTGLAPTVENVSFRGLNPRKAALVAAGVRITGPNATVAQDLEPESVAVAPDSRTAWVTLQRNNALAVVDLAAAEVAAILPLGARDLNVPGAGIDASDRDGRVAIRPWPVLGLYQPDGIGAYLAGGATRLVTANEGDPRSFEEARAADLRLDPRAFPAAAALQLPENLGRLRVSRVEGDAGGDGDFDRLFTFGTRSFAIWTAEGRLVFDSGDAFERITAAAVPQAFNTPDDETAFDATSAARGPEPEPLALGRVDGRDYAFVAFERIGGVVAYDVTDPAAPRFQAYVNYRDFSVDPDEECVDNRPKPPRCAAAGDLGPEAVLFIPAEQSPAGRPLLVLTHEVSDSTTIFRIDPAAGAGAGATVAGR